MGLSAMMVFNLIETNARLEFAYNSAVSRNVALCNGGVQKDLINAIDNQLFEQRRKMNRLMQEVYGFNKLPWYSRIFRKINVSCIL